MKTSRGQYLAAFLSLLPLVTLIIGYLSNNLTANPIQAATLRSGRTAINLLILSLACTPIRNIFGLRAFMKIRKTLGLFSFSYAVLHFLIFAGLDFQFNFSWIGAEIIQKPFIQIGLAALVLLIPLAITSFKLTQKDIGNKWGKIHKLVYAAAILSILHYVLATKGNFFKPTLYALITVVLLLLRIPQLNLLNISKDSRILKSLDNFLLK
jgi:sulfoxide reductase heme-binding subunit YedZ